MKKLIFFTLLFALSVQAAKEKKVSFADPVAIDVCDLKQQAYNAVEKAFDDKYYEIPDSAEEKKLFRRFFLEAAKKKSLEIDLQRDIAHINRMLKEIERARAATLKKHAEEWLQLRDQIEAEYYGEKDYKKLQLLSKHRNAVVDFLHDKYGVDYVKEVLRKMHDIDKERKVAAIIQYGGTRAGGKKDK